MESGAKGCEVVVSGKLRAARAKSMKFTDGFMIHSGQPVINLSFLTRSNFRSAISLILLHVTSFFVKACSESKSKSSPMNFLVGRARNLFLMLSSLSNQRRLMLKVLANHEVLTSILVLSILYHRLQNNKVLIKVVISRARIRKVVFSRRFISSVGREYNGE
jgi:hypothetical protein